MSKDKVDRVLPQKLEELESCTAGESYIVAASLNDATLIAAARKRLAIERKLTKQNCLDTAILYELTRRLEKKLPFKL